MAELAQRAPTDRSRPLRVIGAGMGRTGTASFTAALEILLDGPALHGGSASLYREEGKKAYLNRKLLSFLFLILLLAFIKKWIELLHLSTKPDVNKQVIHKGLHELCDGYVGVMDAPPNEFVEEFLEAYPEAVCHLYDKRPSEVVD